MTTDTFSVFGYLICLEAAGPLSSLHHFVFFLCEKDARVISLLILIQVGILVVCMFTIGNQSCALFAEPHLFVSFVQAKRKGRGGCEKAVRIERD